MSGKLLKTKKPSVAPKAKVAHGPWCLLAFAVGLGWTGVGCGVAALQGDLWTFLQNWVHLQGFFLVSLGIWLFLIIRSKALFERIACIGVDGVTNLGQLAKPRIRYGIIV